LTAREVQNFADLFLGYSELQFIIAISCGDGSLEKD
jgi:hypothetical protein